MVGQYLLHRKFVFYILAESQKIDIVKEGKIEGHSGGEVIFAFGQKV